MARRCLEKFVINGSDYSLMQIDLNDISLDSYSERTNLYLQSGTSTPSYVTDTGYNFDNLIPNITVTVDIPIENSVNASVHNRPYQLGGRTAGFIGINYNETNEYIGSGGTNHSKDCFAIILDDSGYAWILQYGIESGYSWVEAIGGNNSIGQSIYNNFKQSTGGGAGSGYIGNTLLSNKKMVGYNVPTSSAESTKTESVNVFSANAEENKPKAGNGFARIKFLRDAQWVTGEYNYEDVALSNDITKYITSGAYDGSIISNNNEVYYAPYYHTDYIFYGGAEYRRPWSYNSVDSCFELADVNTGYYRNNPHTVWQFPIKKMRNVTKIEFDLKIVKTSYSFPNCYMLISCVKYKSENERDNVPNSSNIAILTIARDIVPPLSYDIKVNDDNWHTYSLESNNLDYVDYIVITAIAGKYDLRIKKIYGDLRQ